MHNRQNFQMRQIVETHILPQSYFNRVWSVIQPSKLRAVLHVYFGANHSPASSDSDRDLSSGSPQERVRFIGENPLPWQMGRRCSGQTVDSVTTESVWQRGLRLR